MYLRMLGLAIAMILGLSVALICGVMWIGDPPGGPDPDPGLLVLGALAGLVVAVVSLRELLRSNRRWMDDFRASLAPVGERVLARWTVGPEMWSAFAEAERREDDSARGCVSVFFGGMFTIIGFFVGFSAFGIVPGLAIAAGVGVVSSLGFYGLDKWVRELRWRRTASDGEREIVLGHDGLLIGGETVPWNHFGVELESIDFAEFDEDAGKPALLTAVVLVRSRNVIRRTHRAPVPDEDVEQVRAAVEEIRRSRA